MNYKYRGKKNTLLYEEDRKPKYGLKKLSIGIVSCFLGCAIYFGAGITVNAQEPTSSVPTEVSSTADTTNVSEETPTNDEELTVNETLNNGENQPQPNSETVEKNDSTEVSEENAPSDTVVPENNSEVNEEPSTNVVEEPSTNVVEEPSTNVVEEPSTNVVEEPSTNVVEEPSTNVVEEPSTNVVEERSDETATQPTEEAKTAAEHNIGRNDNSGTYAPQIHWVDFSGFTNLDANGSLTTDSVLVTTLKDGYELTIKVKQLAPFVTSKSYAEMLAKYNAANGTSYTLPEGIENTVNVTGNGSGVGPSQFDMRNKSTKVPQVNEDGTVTYVNASIPLGYNVLQAADYAIEDSDGKYVIAKTPNSDVINAGITLELSATYWGKPAPVNLIAADGEEVRFREFIAMVTDGTPWSLLDISGATEFTNVDGELLDISGQLVHDRTTDPKKFALWGNRNKEENTSLPYLNATNADGDIIANYKEMGYWDVLDNTTFGNEDIIAYYAEKIAETEAAIANPNSVGELDELNAVLAAYKKLHSAAVVGAGTQTVGNYSEVHQYGNPLWLSNNVREFSFYWNSPAQQNMRFGFIFHDEGDAPISYGTASHVIPASNTAAKPYLGTVEPDLNMIENSEADPYAGDDLENHADEGEEQLVGVGNTYVIHDGSTISYSLDIIANNDNKDSTATAYVYGWIDFNNDGVFSDDEKSSLGVVTGQNQNITLTWSGDNVRVTDTDISKLATRIRISTDSLSILEATGAAPDGEVEDFQIDVVHPPKGSKEITVGYRGETQTATVSFEAFGQVARTETTNVIDTAEASYIVDSNGQPVTLDAEGYYVVPSEGKYKITDNGTDVAVEFVPEADFVGKAAGITIRRTDLNNKTTGWTDETDENVSEQTNTMDGRYIPVVKTKGEVLVHYVNEKDEPIKEDYTDTNLVDLIDDNGDPVTVQYDTAQDDTEKPQTIIKDGKTYAFAQVKEGDVESGDVVEGTTEVTYIYRLVTGNVIVNYYALDADGKEILDVNGNKLTIKPTNPVVENGDVDAPYDTTTEDIKVPEIEYNGVTYRLVKNDGDDEKGKVEGDQQKAVNYYYAPVVGEVIVHYQDENGNPIAPDKIDTPAKTPVGTAYDTSDNKPTHIVTEDGRTYELVPTKTVGDETGKVVEGTTNVTYVYREVKDDKPVVPTIPTSPETPNNIDTPAKTPVGTADTPVNKPTRIVTEDVRTYELVPTKTVGDETGEVVEGTTNVTYVYHEVKGDKPKDDKPVVPTIPTSPETPNKSGSPTTHTAQGTPDVSRVLPQTSGDTTNMTSILGGLALSLGSLLALFKEKRRKQKHSC
ncbi:MucBP domain-containing protein [Lysinibacillus capsici]|uniref:MucBP domain-containing protein n=1 Tax=Lysinibacillus capsici TaxID=2115968 RepID=UPI002E2146F5|nr:MucBP domain-containing protein [Lysinibacillus capsici]